MRKLLATAARPTLPLSAAVFALGCAANIGASGEADTTTEDVGVEQSAIQLAQLRIGPFARSGVLGGNNDGSRATGALQIPIPTETRADGIPVRGTCGVTFVSPHFAITAAHCVSHKFPVTLQTALTVEHYMLDGVTGEDILRQAAVSGTFPNYTRDRLTAAEGYTVTRETSCFVRRRCASDSDNSFGRDNCPFSDVVDIALLECRDRGWFTGYVPVAATETIGEAVSMYWYHEVLDMPAKDPGMPPWFDVQQRWYHYGFLGERSENFHYLGGNRNQLLPLISSRFDDRPTRSLERSGNDTWTNLGGCHGSSGSGAFHRRDGVLELLGPISHGSDFSGLCTGIGPDDEDDRNMAYIRPIFTRPLAATSEVRADIERAREEWQELIDRLRDAAQLPDPWPFPGPNP